MAVQTSNRIEQKSLLMECLQTLKSEVERELKKDDERTALERCVAIEAANLANQNNGEVPPPFNLMGNPAYVRRSKDPPKPCIVICQTSTTVTLKMPFIQSYASQGGKKGSLASLAVYGKPSGSGVAVSLHNDDYPGTGVEKEAGSIVQVTGLLPNHKYVFAAGGYPHGPIGETCDVFTELPLSTTLIQAYLAEISFKLKHYAIAKKAAESVCARFMDKSESQAFHQLNFARIETKSFPLLKQVAECFLMIGALSKLMKTDPRNKSKDRTPSKIEKQRVQL